MQSLKVFALVAVVVATVSAQNPTREIESNRCLQLLRPAFSQEQYSGTISSCLKSLNAVIKSNNSLSDKVKRELVARCIARGLGLIDSQSNINKSRVLSLISQSQDLNQSQKDRFSQAVQNCNDFTTCLSQECGGI